MANITITSTTNSIKVDFGVYHPNPLEAARGVWRKNVISFQEHINYVEVNIKSEKPWCVSHDGNATTETTFQIDTVDGSTTSSISDLFAKLQALIA